MAVIMWEGLLKWDSLKLLVASYFCEGDHTAELFVGDLQKDL